MPNYTMTGIWRHISLNSENCNHALRHNHEIFFPSKNNNEYSYDDTVILCHKKTVLYINLAFVDALRKSTTKFILKQMTN